VHRRCVPLCSSDIPNIFGRHRLHEENRASSEHRLPQPWMEKEMAAQSGKIAAK